MIGFVLLLLASVLCASAKCQCLVTLKAAKAEFGNATASLGRAVVACGSPGNATACPLLIQAASDFVNSTKNILNLNTTCDSTSICPGQGSKSAAELPYFNALVLQKSCVSPSGSCSAELLQAQLDFKKFNSFFFDDILLCSLNCTTKRIVKGKKVKMQIKSLESTTKTTPVSPCVLTLEAAQKQFQNASDTLTKTITICGTGGVAACPMYLEETARAVASTRDILGNATSCKTDPTCPGQAKKSAAEVPTFPLSALASDCAQTNSVCAATLQQASLNFEQFANAIADDILVCCNSPLCVPSN